MISGNFIELHRLADCLTGEVHIRLGLHHKAFLPAETDDIIGGLELHLVELDIQLFRQQTHGEKAHIVAGVLILLPGISKAHDEPVHRAAAFFKQHKISNAPFSN